MLSAGLPMIFQPEAEDMMAAAGFDIRPYIVRTPQHIRTSLDTRDWIAREQRERWWRPYRTRLERDVKTYYEQIRRAER
jgi:hypothetical protein